MNGLRNVRGTLMALKAFQNSKKVLHPEPRRDEWLSIHLDRSFAKKADEDALDSIMEVACSKGLDYISRVYGDSLSIRVFLAENVFQHNATSSHSAPRGPRLGPSC